MRLLCEIPHAPQPTQPKDRSTATIKSSFVAGTLLATWMPSRFTNRCLSGSGATWRHRSSSSLSTIFPSSSQHLPQRIPRAVIATIMSFKGFQKSITRVSRFPRPPPRLCAQTPPHAGCPDRLATSN